MLSTIQKKQILSQIEAYENKVAVGKLNIKLEKIKFDLYVDEYVANPKIMNSGIEMANFLISKKSFIKNKKVLDIGTGSGILGIVVALLGAKEVLMTDIDDNAIKNAKKNVKNLGLDKICKVQKSDLFKDIKKTEKFDILIFNHPYFADTPIKGKSWTRMMLGGTKLLDRYLKNAFKFGNKDAKYLFSWLTIASNKKGLDNDPAKRYKEFGYILNDFIKKQDSGDGVQKGKFLFYEFLYKK